MRSYENYQMKLKDMGRRFWKRGYHITEGLNTNSYILIATRDERRVVMMLIKSKVSFKLAIWVNENIYDNDDCLYMIMEDRR